MKNLQPDEHRLIGKWIKEEGEVKGDQTENRIEFLVNEQLDYIIGSYWTKLYQDPSDARFWERTYLESNRHGGGPQSLICIGKREAHYRFDFEPRDRERRCELTTIFEPDNITKPIEAKEKRIIGT